MTRQGRKKIAVALLQAADAIAGGLTGFDVFGDDYDDQPSSPSPSPSLKAFAGLKRGDVFKLKRSNWVVVRRSDNFTVYVYKFPSMGKKMYTAQVQTDDEIVVFEIGGSGQRIGPDVDRGALKPSAIKEGAGLDIHGEILRPSTKRP